MTDLTRAEIEAIRDTEGDTSDWQIITQLLRQIDEIKDQREHAWKMVEQADNAVCQGLADRLQTKIKLNKALVIIQELMEMMDWVGAGNSDSALIDRQSFEFRVAEIISKEKD